MIEIVLFCNETLKFVCSFSSLKVIENMTFRKEKIISKLFWNGSFNNPVARVNCLLVADENQKLKASATVRNFNLKVVVNITLKFICY